MVRLVPNDEVAALRPGPKSKAFNFEVTPSLDEAIRYFVMAIAAREHRGDGEAHASMLVHTSMLNSAHELCRAAVKPHLENLASKLHQQNAVLLEEMRQQWERESLAVEAQRFGNTPVSFDDISDRLASCASSIRVMVENWSSTERIDYSRPSQRYLVIGGNVLARGLTLNGLMVSFFMRTSSQYDTLMQMGRWFGYRRGFEEIPRIWMEESIRDAFFELATVEEEIRRDVARYGEENVTPQEFAVRIRQIPGLMITSRSRMRHAGTVQIGYAGRHLQTIRFYRTDLHWLQENWRAGSRLVESGVPVEAASGAKVFRVSAASMDDFLNRYKVHPAASGFDTALIRAYINKAREEDTAFDVWNVAIVSPEHSQPSQDALGGSVVNCVNRSRMKGDGDAFIKALMSKRDLLIDMHATDGIDASTWDKPKNARKEANMPPLLLLYPIDRRSTPKQSNQNSDRQPLDAVHDVLGIGIVFPGDPERSHTYISVNLDPVEAEGDEYQGADALPPEVIADE